MASATLSAAHRQEIDKQRLQRAAVALLDLAPVFGQEAFKWIVSANERLALGNLLDFCFRRVIVGEDATAPPGEVLQKGLLHFFQLGRECILQFFSCCVSAPALHALHTL